MPTRPTRNRQAFDRAKQYIQAIQDTTACPRALALSLALKIVTRRLTLTQAIRQAHETIIL